jgi:hypothetical protein
LHGDEYCATAAHRTSQHLRRLRRSTKTPEMAATTPTKLIGNSATESTRCVRSSSAVVTELNTPTSTADFAEVSDSTPTNAATISNNQPNATWLPVGTGDRADLGQCGRADHSQVQHFAPRYTDQPCFSTTPGGNTEMLSSPT